MVCRAKSNPSFKFFVNPDKYNDVGVFNFLIGESILKSTNINDKIREFLN